MRISDWSSYVCSSDLIAVTLFEWRDIPKIQYGPQNVRISGTAKLGLVTISTDEGLQGHAFLGAAMRWADLDANTIVSSLKPELRSEEHTSELQSLMRISYAVFCLKKKNIQTTILSRSHQLN